MTRPQLPQVDIRAYPASILLIGRNSGIYKHYSKHAILNRGKETGQGIDLNPVPTGKNGISDIGIQISEGS
jgi:hypothetical protein